MDNSTYQRWVRLKQVLLEAGKTDSPFYELACAHVNQRPIMPPFPNSDAKITESDIF